MLLQEFFKKIHWHPRFKISSTYFRIDNCSGFHCRRPETGYSAKKITDAVYADKLVLFAEKSGDAKTLLHTCKEVTAQIDLQSGQ